MRDESDLSRFPVRLTLAVQWGEMDAMGHVNNTVYFRWFETARMEYFRRIGGQELQRATGVGPILHSTSARFRAPVTFPDRVEVAARARDLEADRLTMDYLVWSESLGRVAAEGSGVLVAYDYRAGAKAPLPEAIRRAIEALEASVGVAARAGG